MTTARAGINSKEHTEFVRESNRIEPDIGDREPTVEEMAEYYRLMALDEVNIAELERFVQVYAPDAPVTEGSRDECARRQLLSTRWGHSYRNAVNRHIAGCPIFYARLLFWAKGFAELSL